MLSSKHREDLQKIARHWRKETFRSPWPVLINYAQIKARMGEFTADDAEAIYDIVRREYDRVIDRDTEVNANARAAAISKIRRAIINSGE